MTMLWQCYANVTTMLWQYYANVTTMLWQCYANVITMLRQWYANVMTMLWQCYDNVMPMLWQCCDNVIPMLWQYYDNVITMLSECYNIVMTLLWHCYDNVMPMFWQCCDNVMIMLRQSWEHLGDTLGIYWGHPGTYLGQLWDIFGTSLGHLWDIFGTSWRHLGDIVGTCWCWCWCCESSNTSERTIVPRTVILFPFTPTVLLMIYWIIHKIYDVPSIMWGKAGKKLQRSWQRRVVFTSCPYLIFATRTPAAVLVQKKLSAWAWFSSKTLPQAKRHRPSLLFTAKIYFSARIKTMLESSNIFLPCTTMFKAWTSSRLVGVEMQGSLFFVIKI